MLQMTGAFAEFERAMIQARIHAGLRGALLPIAGSLAGRCESWRDPAKHGSRWATALASIAWRSWSGSAMALCSGSKWKMVVT